MVEKHDIMLEILHKFNPIAPIRAPENCDIKPNFYQPFSVDHVIIITIISRPITFLVELFISHCTLFGWHGYYCMDGFLMLKQTFSRDVLGTNKR